MSERALVLHKAEPFRVPAIIADVRPEASKRFFEYFTVPIRNKNTQMAYYQAPTVKQHMAAIRMLFSWLTEKGVLAMNPAREVKTERFSRTEGKTPAFVEGEVQKLLGAIETSTHTGLKHFKHTLEKTK